ncbi:MAG: DUF3781 domain-containing protein [Erysipelotrichaceae bacterium]|nr:DUF3781 domain-containing protein [Erysipelotrichaceae bacterium]
MNNNDLLDNIDKLHTTELGEDRIRKNLKVNNNDVIAFLKEKILDKDCLIYKKGKNYYCEIGKIRITVNSYNFCIITAHLMNK